MFDSVRKHQRVMLGVVLLLIFPAFVFFGLTGYEQMLGSRDDAAVVGGTRISRASVDEAHRQQIERMRSMLGEQIDVRLLDTPQARSQALESLITQQALFADANKRHITVTPAQIQKLVVSMPAFQGEDGQFSFDQYQLVLARNQRTPRMFENEIAQDFRTQAVTSVIQASAFEPRSVVERVFAAQEARRTVRAMLIDPKSLEAGLAPTDEQLRKYFDEHAERYRQPESVDLDYLVLERSKLTPEGKPSEDELKAFYEQNRARYGQPDSRRASHILFAVASGADEAARSAAREEAEKVLAEAKAAPERFAELAKAHSKDSGSAEAGGDLGFFDREMMVKPFADAAFSTAPGDFTPVVESEFGFHVIRVTEAREGGAKPFADVRGELVDTWNQQQAARRYAELAEQFRNLVYEQSDTLEPAAQKFALTVQKATGVPRTPAPGTAGPLGNARLLEAVYNDESLRGGRNIDAMEITPGVLVSARVAKHNPARALAFDEVKDRARAQWILDEAARLARERGEAELARLKALDAKSRAQTPEGFAPPDVITRAVSGELGPLAVTAAFAIPAADLPAFTGVDLGTRGYQLLQIEKAEGPAADAEQRRELYVTQYDQVAGQTDASIWVQDVLGRTEIERHRTN